MTSTDPAEPAQRLDSALTERALARSRSVAAESIRAGLVRLNGVVVRKPAASVRSGDRIDVEAQPGDHYVSRGAHKLSGTLRALEVPVAGLRCVDVGSSTGGFTQVLLEHGAVEVSAIDVGTDQLAASLRADPRVRCMEGTHIGRDDLSGVRPAGLVVADLSFISLRNVMAALGALVAEGGVLLPMVKPQFEVGRSRLGKGGVVVDDADRRDAVAGVVDAAAQQGFAARGICTSPLPGPAGNVEYFVRLERGAPTDGFDVLWAARDAHVRD